MKRYAIKRYIYLTLGIIFAILGAIGIILPLVPTTPFLLVASFCFSRSSDKLNNYILNNRIFGSYIENYQKGTGVTLESKITALVFLWIVLAVSFIFNDNLYIRLMLATVGIGVTTHLFMIKLKK